jgi:hypothetical protein
VMESAIVDLLDQGCDVHYIDNWSSDNTHATLQNLEKQYPSRISFELFPTVKTNTYNWAEILTRKTEYASQIKADWIVHVDPDELRESPWGRQVPLRQALFVADQLSYNVVNFANLVIFHPVSDTNFVPGPSSMRAAFKYFSFNQFGGDSVQMKAWKTYFSHCKGDFTFGGPVRVDLASKGGHIVLYEKPYPRGFPKLRLFPYKFFLRHYPIRSQKHGMRKVFKERKARWNVTERLNNDWHKQYEDVQEKHNFLGDRSVLNVTVNDGDLPLEMYSSLLPCLPHHNLKSTRMDKFN